MNHSLTQGFWHFGDTEVLTLVRLDGDRKTLSLGVSLTHARDEPGRLNWWDAERPERAKAKTRALSLGE
jgi:hypothetical protein